LLYLPFSRVPDYFDSETAPAQVVAQGDSIVAKYNEFGKPYQIKLDPIQFRSKIGTQIEVVYELSHPEKAAVNQLWGYWLIPIELAWSFGLFAVLLGVAYATTHRPHPSAIAEQLKGEEGPKTKYE
jgi:hypothetical protein